MNAIELNSVDYSYDRPGLTVQGAKALNAVTLTVEQGEFVTLLGSSGSGKTTLLKLCNGLLLPTAGAVRIAGMATHDDDRLWEIRRSAGMIFQNPDDQIIGATVAEDVAFGPENLGLSPLEIRNRVTAALLAVGMAEFDDCATCSLSIAQKLRVALAGVLAMQPKCILADDAAALLDPDDRLVFLSLLHQINRTEGITVLQATRNCEEAVFADRIVILAAGVAGPC